MELIKSQPRTSMRDYISQLASKQLEFPLVGLEGDAVDRVV